MCRQPLRYIVSNDLISSDLLIVTHVFGPHLDFLQIHAVVLDELISTPLHTSSCSSSIYSITWKYDVVIGSNPNRASPTEWMLVGSSLNFLVVRLQTTKWYNPLAPRHQHWMRLLQIFETTTLSKVKGKKDKDGCSPVTLVQHRLPWSMSQKKLAKVRGKTLWLLQSLMSQIQE